MVLGNKPFPEQEMCAGFLTLAFSGLRCSATYLSLVKMSLVSYLCSLSKQIRGFCLPWK